MDIGGDLDATTPRPFAHTNLPPVPETKEATIDTKPQDSPTRGRTGLGNLMQSAKRDVQVPEFDMGAFF